MPKSRFHFNISERKVLLRVVDMLSILGVLYLLSSVFHFNYFSITKENCSWIIVLTIYISLFGTIFEIYDLQKASLKDAIFGNILLTASVTVLFYLLTPIFTPTLPVNRLQIVYFYLAIILALTLWRLVYIHFITTPRFYKRVLIIGEVSNKKSVLDAFKNSDPNYKIVGFVDGESTKSRKSQYHALPEYNYNELQEVIEKENITEVIVSSYNTDSITSHVYNDLISLLEKGIPIREFTHVVESMTHRLPVQFVGKDFYKYFPFSKNNQNKFYLFFRRFFDVGISLIGVVVGVCLVPIVLFGNLIANRGSLFYSQKRVGENGELFSILKFRTMIENAEKNGAVWAKKNDIRVTPFGKFLRRSRLDEFPQFLNILKGEMSLIGPRPERPYFVKELSHVIPFYETRHIIKPGLTGWAQVKVRYGSTVEDSLLKLQYDLYYIKHRNFFLDINVILKTLSTMVFFRGQ